MNQNVVNNLKMSLNRRKLNTCVPVRNIPIKQTDPIIMQIVGLMILVFMSGLLYACFNLRLAIFNFIAICGSLTAYIAVTKGRNRFAWFFIGVWCGPLAYILVCGSENIKNNDDGHEDSIP